MSNLDTAIFYTCGTCNLKCRYCGIHKSSVLKQIDKVLEKSFEGDYYFNRVKEFFPRKDMLTSFETWGGEPFAKMERFHPTLRKLIEYYPYLNSGYSSTNFSYSEWTNKFFGLMDVFGEYSYRNFHYTLQLSVDGPAYINDAGRGEGVTEKCLANFNKMVSLLKEGRLPKNVNLFINLKGTLDNDSLIKLANKEKIIEYYQFFENNFIIPIKELSLENVNIGLAIPNTAVPSPVTVEDGKNFAEVVKLCREIEKENEEKNYFKHYKTITIFSNSNCQNCLSYRYGYHNCGTGSSLIGFLPNNMLSTCHEGFTQIVEQYQQLAAKDSRQASSITFDKFLNEQAVSLCVNEKGYQQHVEKMKTYNVDNAAARLSSNVAMIMALAMAGQIEECFLDETNALKAGIFIQSKTAYCIKDNYNKTGSYGTVPIGIYKLLLNGAMKYIQNDDELRVE